MRDMHARMHVRWVRTYVRIHTYVQEPLDAGGSRSQYIDMESHDVGGRMYMHETRRHE
jgi:hypothetical protein